MGTVNLTDAVTGTQISSATFNNNNASLETALNGGIDDANLETAKIITGSVHFKQDGATDGQVYAYDGLTDNRWEPRTITTLLQGQLLGVVSYNPSTETTTTTTSTTSSDVDATNLSLAITIPVGGTKILVRFSAHVATNPQYCYWCLRESTNEIAAAKITASQAGRNGIDLLVTGLAAGAHTYKWVIKTVQAGIAAGIQYGVDGSPDSSSPGPAVMSIWAVV